MTSVAPASKVARQNDWIVVIFFSLVALYFLYDGWINENYQRRTMQWPFTVQEITDPQSLLESMKVPQTPAQQFLMSKASLEAKALLNARLSDEVLTIKLVDELNRMASQQSDLYNAQAFMGAALSEETQAFLTIEEPEKAETFIRNKRLIADAFPKAITITTWKDGRPTPNLNFNRIYGPIICLAVGLYFLLSVLKSKDRHVTADDSAVAIDGKLTIPYPSITKIDRRFFEKEGHFTLEYQQGDAVKKIKLSARKYDALAPVLDEIIKNAAGRASSDSE